ncbi:MAG: ankyrin repeat domain-containing protein, partial [Flammeovirgaceae bacterium]
NNDVKCMAIMNIQGWRVNAYDYDGRTALGIAASEGHLEAVQYLIENGANPQHKDARGNNALDDALREKRYATADYLRSQMESNKNFLGNTKRP